MRLIISFIGGSAVVAALFSAISPQAASSATVTASAEVSASVPTVLHNPNFEGNWEVTDMKCGGQEPNAGTRSLYTRPNSITVQINMAKGAFVS